VGGPRSQVGRPASATVLPTECKWPYGCASRDRNGSRRIAASNTWVGANMSAVTAPAPTKRPAPKSSALATLVRVIRWRTVASGWLLTMTATALLITTSAPRVVSAIALGATVALVIASIVVPVALERKLRDLANESVASLTTPDAAPRQQRAAVPAWTLRVLDAQDAQRYAAEWSAHISQLLDEGEDKQARKDRRRLAVAALVLGVALRVRRLVHSH
jgi:hypothetical protein